MLKVLLKKQITEVFKSFFYNEKKNKMRSKGAVAAWIFFFGVIMIGLLGGMFTFLAVFICGDLTEAGMGWLYFLLMNSIAIILGAFGSIFNTYTGLYLAKDNDLLLSLPIPARTIMAARLMNVYLMGTMYAATVLLPALIVYWAVAGVTVSRVVCGLLMLLITTVIVLLLSCVLGWVVAKVSLKLKNKSYITVLISLAFIGAYYFLYFRAMDLLRDLVQNVQVYGEKIKGAAYGLYLFGRIGEGDWLATAIYLVVTAALSVLVWTLMNRSFLKIASSSGSTGKVRYVEKKVRAKTAFGAMLSKEFARFTSSANYMLNCGLGILLIPAFGVLLLFKGREICEVINEVFVSRPDCAAVFVCAMFCMITSMIDMATPSVSLEGKSLWIPRTLPVQTRTVLRAKVSVQLLLSGIPMLLACICAMIVVPGSPAVRVAMVAATLAYTVFTAMYDMVIGIRMPVLGWANETTPVKQSAAVIIVIFTGWIFSFALAGLYMWIGYKIGAVWYLLICTVLFGGVAFLLMRWMDTGGVKAFEKL